MDIYAFFDALAQINRPLAMRDLKPLSDFDPAKRTDFLRGWSRIPELRRSEIARSMLDLAEDNVDLQFQTVMYWMLDDQSAGIRSYAIEGLWESDNPRVLRRLLELLERDPAVSVRASAAIGLSRFAYLAELGELDDDLADTLREGLLAVARNQQQVIEVRRRALESAGYYGSDDDVLDLIERAYASNEQELKESALVAMGRSMLPRWLPTIGRELESRSPALRYEAARAAGELADEARPLVARVARLLGDSDTEVALAAIWALGQIGGEAAARVLRDARKSESEARAQAAEEALSELAIEDGIMGEMRPPRNPRSGRQN
ncbi:MAG: HEAT repeat domain-containing protein [Roseiflexaceae bacterium]